jgi:hypothetical protein
VYTLFTGYISTEGEALLHKGLRTGYVLLFLDTSPSIKRLALIVHILPLLAELAKSSLAGLTRMIAWRRGFKVPASAPAKALRPLAPWSSDARAGHLYGLLMLAWARYGWIASSRAF